MPRVNYAKELALRAREILDEKKGRDIIILDLRKHTAIAQYFVICSGSSNRHVDAMADEVVFMLKKQGYQCHHVEGAGTGSWVLVDYGDVIIHVFYHQTRHFYALEKLWGDAPRVK